MWDPQRLTTLWAITAWGRDSFTFTFYVSGEPAAPAFRRLYPEYGDSRFLRNVSLCQPNCTASHPRRNLNVRSMFHWSRGNFPLTYSGQLTGLQSILLEPKIVLGSTADSLVGIANTLWAWMTKGSEFESQWRQEISLLHVFQIGSGVQPTSYPLGTRGSFPGGKAAGALTWPITSNRCRGQENVGLYIHSPIRLHGVVLN
jgi:hypothetical protein